MNYMLLIYEDEKGFHGLPEGEREAIYGEYGKLVGDLRASGKFVHGAELHPTTTATSVKLRGGERLVTDGPFAETREQLGGFIVVDVKDLDEALEIAARIPGAKSGTIEVRPVAD